MGNNPEGSCKWITKFNVALYQLSIIILQNAQIYYAFFVSQMLIKRYYGGVTWVD